MKSLEALAREHTQTAFDEIVDLATDCEDPKIRLAAAREILDRGHGKPLSAVITVPATQQQRARLAAMTDEALIDVIEAEFEPLPALPAPTSADYDSPERTIALAEANAEPIASLPELYADPLFN